MASIRTFIAVRASQRVTANAARVVARLSAISDQYRWVVPENLHVTLNFVGDVPDVEVHELCQLVRRTLEPVASFDLSLHGVGGFPQSDQPRVIWLGVDEGADALADIYRLLQDELHV